MRGKKQRKIKKNWHEAAETGIKTTRLQDGQWKSRNEWPDYTGQEPRRQATSYSPPREPEISPRNKWPLRA
jgi:hypothetical protein